MLMDKTNKKVAIQGSSAVLKIKNRNNLLFYLWNFLSGKSNFIYCINFYAQILCQSILASFCFFIVNAIPIIIKAIKLGYMTKKAEWFVTTDNPKARTICKMAVMITPNVPIVKKG